MIIVGLISNHEILFRSIGVPIEANLFFYFHILLKIRNVRKNEIVIVLS